MMPLLFSSSFYLSFFLFFVVVIYFPNHPCIARKSLANKAVEELYFSTDSFRLENSSEGIAKLLKTNRSIKDFYMEKNDSKDTFSGTEMIGSESSPSSLSHARLLKATKIKGARWPATRDLHVASQSGNKNLYRDIEMDYDPPHRKSPIHN